MNIYEAINEDHKIQRSLADQLIDTSGETKKRKETFEALKRELQVHAVAEERYFYVPLMKKDKTQEDARHGVAEHHEMDELIEELEDTDMSSPAWLATAKKLRDKVFHHLKDEEEDFFEAAKKVINTDRVQELERKYRQEMNDGNAGIGVKSTTV